MRRLLLLPSAEVCSSPGHGHMLWLIWQIAHRVEFSFSSWIADPILFLDSICHAFFIRDGARYIWQGSVHRGVGGGGCTVLRCLPRGRHPREGSRRTPQHESTAWEEDGMAEDAGLLLACAIKCVSF